MIKPSEISSDLYRDFVEVKEIGSGKSSEDSKESPSAPSKFYIGEVKGFNFHGRGILVNQKQELYEGLWKNGKK